MNTKVSSSLLDAKSWLENAYARNLPWCISYILKNNGTEQEAKDLFQDSLSVAWMKLHSGTFEGGENEFHAYLKQICRFKWMDQIKLKKKVPLLDITSELADISPSIHEDWKETEAAAIKIKKSLDTLQGRCKQVLFGFYYEKKSLEGIASLLGVTPQSIKTIKYRCMLRLRQAYLDLLESDEEV